MNQLQVQLEQQQKQLEQQQQILQFQLQQQFSAPQANDLDQIRCAGPAQSFFVQGKAKGKRYIATKTQNDFQEAFHPAKRFLQEAADLLEEGLQICDWSTCTPMCVNASVLKAAALIVLKQFPEAKNTISVAMTKYLQQQQFNSQNTEKHQQTLGRLKMMLGFVTEHMGDITQAEMINAQAIQLWPTIEEHYLGILRVKVPDDAPRDEKMKMYFYGQEEQRDALAELLVVKEFDPLNLMEYPLLAFNEPEIFWMDSEHEFKLIKQLMSPFVQHVFARMLASLIDNGHLPFGDGQSQRYYMYNDRTIRFFHVNTIELVRNITGRHLIPSYVYFGGYKPGAVLTPHSDRPVCEYTLSLLTDHSPPGSVWPLGIRRESRTDVTPTFQGGAAPMPPEKEIVWGKDQQPGDGFLILGRHKIHFRDGALPKGMFTRAYFLHYVYDDFQGSLT
eukprot:CAMPEP_0201484672 /NCGR_PEP_ID=MMETSP0151_2-20130828/8831_1 /ASSEMBLY_ACC=CAM_ASM_000257 /TAXON_ID=200890 /ORGANISM="Paramoeba atlantica, Strain 621/1 / CCAP 1560/9" /LENGTH=445 /DNA_ID=CAMNT_0047868447 /DNA_START=264 /DNA_END=1601 /DNA_ORIENTATION=+